ncbi:hypothetical protein LSCM4_05213 [Leishmania orientalis]|uniref:Ubiquitin-like protease family profile domain-containing protein n=1 Tax=Leishmania orientalis TaxID=2249476 RepID=A0A836GLZ1_9TRYP|nr:hypothetical protein LSCM4_05213 [Leishmania orientalis]
MISQLSARQHCAAEASSLSVAATANTATEPHPPSRDREGDLRKSFAPSLSTWASSTTADTPLHDPAAQPGPVTRQPIAAGRPARSPTVRPPPHAVPLGHLHGRCSHLCLASHAGMEALRETTDVGIRGSATTSLASAHTSGMATTHSSTPPPYALVMDSLVRRYRAEEARFSQWRQGGGRFRASAPPRQGSAQLRRRPGGTVEEEGLTHAGLRGSAGDDLSGQRGRDTDSGPRGALPSIVQRLALVQGVQAWWRRSVQPRLAGKASKRVYRVTLPTSATAAADVETLRFSGATDAPVPLSPAAESVSSRPWMGRAGGRLLGRLSHSLSLSSEGGKSIVLEMLRPADAAQTRGVQRGGHDDTAYDSVEEHQRAPGTEMTELTAEAVSADVVAPALSLSCSGSEVALTPSRDKSLQRATAGDGGLADWRQPGDDEQGAKDGLYSPTFTASACSSRSSSVSGGEEAAHSAEASGAADHRPEEGRTGRHEEDGSFMFSSSRALRMHRLCGAAASSSDDAEVVCGGAPRLLEQSRVRLKRWLYRQRRRRAAKRSLRGAGAWFKSAAVDAEPLDAPSGVRYSTAAPPRFSATSELRRRAAQAAASPWEAAMPRIQAGLSGNDSTLWDGGVALATSAAAERPTRAPILERLRATMAAGTAGWNVQPGGLAEIKTVSEVPLSNGEAVVLSPAAQRRREHANDLARLTESLIMLTQFTGRATAGAGIGIHAHRASSPEDLNSAPSMVVGQEPTATAALSPTSPGRATTCALPAWSPFRAHALSIVSAGQHRRSYHDDSQNFRDAEPRARIGKSDAHAAAEAAVDAFRSLLTDATHTSHNVAVRAVYEAIMSEVCTALVRRDVENAIDVSRSAANRALVQWIERQLIAELTQPRAREKQVTVKERKAAALSAVTLQPLVFTGVTQHIRSGVPVSLEHLRLDDFDRHVLESVKARGASDAIAVKFDTGGYDISYRQLSSLSSQSWLNDQVINNYLQLLCVEAEGAASASLPAAQRRHRIASLGTHFYTKAESDLRRCSRGSIDHASCLPQLDPGSATFRWLRNRQHLLEPYNPSNPRSVRVVLAPVNIEAQHWALAVFFCADNRWVLYDSMSRSSTARQRGAMILLHLSHAWRECQRHFGIVRTEGMPTAEHLRPSAAPQLSPLVSACVVAAPYVPFTDTLVTKGCSTAVSPLDSLEPHGSLDQLYRAAKRIRHEEKAFAEEAAQRSLQATSDAGRTDSGVNNVRITDAAPVPRPPPLPLTAATTIPAGQLSDTEVEWFTGGFDRIPQQTNGNDCGVFVCQAAWCVAQGVAVSFAQSDVTRLREVILLELFNKRLLRRYPTADTSSSAGV